GTAASSSTGSAAGWLCATGCLAPCSAGGCSVHWGWSSASAPASCWGPTSWPETGTTDPENDWSGHEAGCSRPRAADRPLFSLAPRDRGGVREARREHWQSPRRFGHPTTPTRARRLIGASVDPTEARNDILGCFGRSDRSAQGDRPTLRSIRP